MPNTTISLSSAETERYHFPPLDFGARTRRHRSVRLPLRADGRSGGVELGSLRLCCVGQRERKGERECVCVYKCMRRCSDCGTCRHRRNCAQPHDCQGHHHHQPSPPSPAPCHIARRRHCRRHRRRCHQRAPVAAQHGLELSVAFATASAMLITPRSSLRPYHGARRRHVAHWLVPACSCVDCARIVLCIRGDGGSAFHKCA